MLVIFYHTNLQIIRISPFGWYENTLNPAIKKAGVERPDESPV